MAVPASRAVAWYGEAMRLWKRGPVVQCVLGAATILAQVGIDLWPEAGPLVSKIVVPLLACGMLYGAHAAAMGGKPLLMHAFAAFRAPAGAIAAVLVSSTLVFAAEWLVADGLAGVDLLRPGASAPDLDTTTVLVVYAVGVFVSLPLSFVPPAALFGGRGFAASFGESVSAFARNPAAFIMSGVFALALIVLGLLTVVGLAIALPLIQCATYAAWRDLAPGAPGATPSEPGRSA